MAAPISLPTGISCAGPGTFTGLRLPAGANVPASYNQMRHRQLFRQESATAAAVEGRVVHVVRGSTANINEFVVGVTVAAVGGATAVVNLYKNGSSILSAAVTIDNTLVAYAHLTGTLSSTALVAGDVLEIKVTAATAGGGTLPKGVFAQVELDEDSD